MKPKTTMMVAQKLYEKGFITYMRTDSTALSDEILEEIHDYVKGEYGNTYLRPKKYAKKTKNSQEAHEAIRPIHIEDVSIENKAGVTSQENKLYQLIWKRTVASQMSPAQNRNYTLNIVMSNCREKIVSKMSVLIFLGYKIVYNEDFNEKK